MMTSRIGIGFITMISVIALGSCHYGEPYVAPYVEPERVVCRFMGAPCAPDCWKFYNNGRHDEWASCMGVSYR